MILVLILIDIAPIENQSGKNSIPEKFEPIPKIINQIWIDVGKSSKYSFKRSYRATRSFASPVALLTYLGRSRVGKRRRV